MQVQGHGRVRTWKGRERGQGLEWPLGFEGTVWRMRDRYNPTKLFPFLPTAQELRGVSLRWGWGSVSWAGGLKVSSGHFEFSLQGTDLKKRLRMFLLRPWREGTQLPQPCSYSSPHLTLSLMQKQTNFKDR